jgi:small-conductance mechanosensitive channel
VAYYEDIDRVMQVINRVGTELAEDPDYQSMIITPPKALRVNDLNDKGIMIRVYGDTKPLKQWDVAGEMRKRIKAVSGKTLWDTSMNTADIALKTESLKRRRRHSGP